MAAASGAERAFVDATRRLTDVLFETEPFHSRKGDFNVRALHVPSAEPGRSTFARKASVGSVIKKRRKKMRKHKKRKLLRRARHKRKR